ncbi:MAG: hypothetical protein QGF24_00815 [Dehalococcoidia bacterium]|nr:hypothetical protein [Dehalococcoidia bacterium]
MWTAFLTGSTRHVTSDLRHFRGNPRFDGQLHMCPVEAGYIDGNTSGSAAWSMSPSVVNWFEVALTH